MLGKYSFRKFITLATLVTVWTAYSMVALAAPTGSTAEISVTGQVAAVQTESAERAGLITSREMQEIPLKGRSYIGTTKLLPGIIDTATRESPGWNDLVGININGTRAGAIDLNLDGITSRYRFPDRPLSCSQHRRGCRSEGFAE